MQVLMHLAERAGQVISRNELLAGVWGETFVQEEALTQAVSQLRRTLDDDPRSPTIIQTIPKQGYRLIAEVTIGTPGDSATPATDRQTETTTTTTGPGRSGVRRLLPFIAGVLIAVIAYVAVMRQGKQTPDAFILDELPLTTLPGDEIYPALSPDGTLVVFGWLAEDAAGAKLYLKHIGSEDVTPLTNEPGVESTPCWSPDGERIAFSRRGPDGRRVCVVAAMGGAVQELGPLHAFLGGIDWAPDGQTIVYSGKDKREAPMRLMSLRVADGRVDTLTTPGQTDRGDMFPRFSPDGKQLAYVHGDRGASRDVHVMPASGGPAVRLTSGFFSCGGMAWAADGQSLLLSATMRGPYEMWRVALDDQPPTLLATRGHRSLGPSCARQSDAMVFVERHIDTDIRLLHFAGSTESRTVAASTRIDGSPRFSPDGSTVLFISERSGSSELWLSDLENGSVRQLTTAVGDALRKPRWSPDGRRVAVNAARDGLLQVVVIDVSSGLQRQVTPGDGHYRLGHWSTDGQWVFYSREEGPDWQISKVRLDGTGAVDQPFAGCLSIHEQADGGLLYFKETADGLFRRHEGGDEEILVGPSDLHDTLNLEVTDEGYWFIRWDASQWYLAFYDFVTGTTENRAQLPGVLVGQFNLATDGQSLLYTVVTRSDSDLRIVPDLPR